MNIVIIGAGSVAVTVADIIYRNHSLKLSGFVGREEDEQTFKDVGGYSEVPFLGDYAVLPKLKIGDIDGYVVAVGDNRIRETLFYEVLATGLIPVNVVSSDAVVSNSVSLGKGVVIAPGVVLSHGVRVGDNVIVDSGSVLDVNVTVGDHGLIGAGVTIAGGALVGKAVTLGAGSVVDSGCSVGKNCNLSAGTVVCKNIPGRYREEGNDV